MINKDFFEALDTLEKQKKISKEYFIEALEAALTSAYKKNFGEAKLAQVKLIPEKSQIRVYAYKKIVETVEDPDKEIALIDAQIIKKSFAIGDIVTEEVTPKDFGRIAAQTAKQVVMQRLREAERGIMLTELSEKEAQLLTTIVRRTEGKNVFVDIGNNTEAVMLASEQIPGEKYVAGDRVKVYVKDIKDSYSGPQIIVSRSAPEFVCKLFELETPEIMTGEVIIKSIVREAGYRTKIAVHSDNVNLDPVGACVGNKGMRVNAVVAELSGEKIDIIRWSEDIFEYIARALSPAKVISVQVDYDTKGARVIVPDDKLSLAIGKSGQNARLAARLTGWKIDVKSESVANALQQEPIVAIEDADSVSAEKADEITETNLFADIDSIE
ncbi:MAG: transcription termination factor NusA [Clostridia bacterium]|nr:transcription termination factor NusA [Clostridia bacterium]